MIQLLQPRSFGDWHIKLTQKEDRIIFHHYQNDKEFYSYTAYLNSQEQKELFDCFKSNNKSSLIPPIYFTEPYLSKIRTALNWKPNIWNFFDFFKNPIA